MKRSLRWLAFVMALLFALIPVSALQESMDVKYNQAHELLAEGKYEEAIRAFDAISTYEDASKLSLYAKAIAAVEGGDYEAALTSFAVLGEYKDCPMLIKYYTAHQYEGQGSADNWNQWILAAETYDELGLFRDSLERAGNCRKSVYDVGIQMREAGNWDGAVDVFSHLGAYSDAAIQILETYYQQAKNHYDSGNYAEAYKVYKQIAGYSNVDSLLSTDNHLLTVAAAHEAKMAPYKTIGSIVTFGQYEQDNNTGNGPEEIEWIVLDVQDEKSLLLSRYGLDVKKYHTEWMEITWEECSLRVWLNNDFLKKAFTPAEQHAILLTAIDNSQSQGYSDWGTSGGSDTQDYLFLLSYAEANKYLGVTSTNFKNMKSQVALTAYVMALGASTWDDYKTADGEAAGWWWLRSPGHNQYHATKVFIDGSLSEGGVCDDGTVVRPAFWLNLESDIF